MKDSRETWYDQEKRVSITLVDVTSAAQALARGHLAGPTASYYLTQALASAALFGGEMSEKDETVIVQMKCSGPLGGFNVECTDRGTLRGYTEKKVLDDFDGMGRPKDEKVLGSCQFQITRSVPGKVLSQGVATSLNAYLRDSLQRNAFMLLEAAVSDEVEIKTARGMLVEIMPDSAVKSPLDLAKGPIRLAVASRNILSQLGCEKAELRKTDPLAFVCRCSPERAVAMLSALSEEERASLPPTIDITCHMCGRIFTASTR